MTIDNKTAIQQNTTGAFQQGRAAGRAAFRQNKAIDNPFDIETSEQEYLSWEEGYMAGYPDAGKITIATKGGAK